MKKIFIVLFVLSLVGCKDKSGLSYSEKVFEQKIDSDCEEFCPYAKLKITEFDSKNNVSDSINSIVFEHFKSILSFEEEPYQATNYDELIQSFLGSYKALLEKYPDETIGWEATGTSEVSFQNEKIINIKTEYYLYTGGAHGNSGIHSFFFDVKTGKNLSYREIFTDWDSFTQLAEQKFREKFHITPEMNINSNRFMFEEDEFKLPETIFLTNKGILLVYNTYEIASYADGIQEVVIPFDGVQIF